MRPTLLIVDDHDGFRASARALLEAEGFDVIGEAADGARGVVVYPLWQNEAVTIVLAMLLIAVSARDHLHTVGQSRRAHVGALQASAALGIALVAQATIRLALPAGTGSGPLLLVYEAVLVGIAAWLCAGLLSAPWERVDVANLVVELGA